MRLLLVPGNPGCSPFYSPFMSSLHTLLRGRAEIICISHLGMDRQGFVQDQDQLFGLEEQIEHKLAYLKDLSGPIPLVVVSWVVGT